MNRAFQLLKYFFLILVLTTAYTNCGKFNTQDNDLNPTSNSASGTENDQRLVGTFSYSTTIANYWSNVQIQINSPLKSYGPGVYTISPTLPTGLSLNSLTGDISGTPTALQSPKTYKVTFTNAKNLATSNLVIQIKMPMLSYSYSSATYTVGQPITPNIPKLNTESDSVTYSVTPSLPDGLRLDPVTGIISGQTTGVSLKTEYIVLAEGAFGKAYAQLYLRSVKLGRPFQYTLKTTTLNEAYSLSLVDGYEYNFEVSWGDGTRSTISNANDTKKNHIYQNPGIYTVTLTGLVESWQRSCSTSNIQDVIDLGEVGWSNLKYAFYECKELKSVQGGDTSQVTDMSYMFTFTTAVNLDVSMWDTSQVTNMTVMFGYITSVNPDVSKWNTSKVTDMSAMFYAAKSANPNVSKWDTSNVTSMSYMFYAATSANPDVSKWNTSKVTDMNGMFLSATSANPDVSRWDTSKVTNMSSMFSSAISANPDVSKWDTSKVTNMSSMFSNTSSTNPDVSKWNTSNVTDMSLMFSSAISANPDVSKWDTSKVTNMSSMFLSATSVNPDVSKWDTSKVTSMSYMFYSAISANPDVSKWDTSKVTRMSAMFYSAKSANPDVSKWDTSRVTDISSMFYEATVAKPNIGEWNLSSLLYAKNFISSSSSLDVNVYSTFLVKTAELTEARSKPLPIVVINMGKSKYLPSASEAKKYLESLSWTITDGGELN